MAVVVAPAAAVPSGHRARAVYVDVHGGGGGFGGVDGDVCAIVLRFDRVRSWT